jgi:integrase/recombinase XerC
VGRFLPRPGPLCKSNEGIVLMVERFLKYIRYEKRYSEHTVLAYRTDLLQFSDFISKSFDDVPENANYGIIRSWIISLSEADVDARSINRKIACLRSFFKFLLKQGVVTKDPVVRIKILKSKKQLPHFVPESDMAAILDSSGIPDDHEGLRNLLVVELLYGTGMRLSELINLRDTSINYSDSSVKVLGKRNKERIIPFSEPLVNLLKKYREVRDREIGKQLPFLLVTSKGKKLYPVLVNRIVKRTLAQAGVEKKSPHVLRHSYATHLLNNGAEINAVKDLLGHSSLAATQVYTHNTMEKLKKIFDQAHPKA